MTITLNNNAKLNRGDIVAVGDIHGRIDLLWEFVSRVRDTGIHLIFLGDLIDRARKPEDDVAVLNVVRTLRDNPEQYGLSTVAVLRGNHEQMFLDAVEEHEKGSMLWRPDTDLWIRNGGSFEVFDELREHTEWLRKLSFYRLIGTTLFVHAGVRPHVPLHEQTQDDLVWIRRPFLDWGPKNVKGVDLVVHGHTPNWDGEPVIRENRVCLDSAAYETGILTGFNSSTGELFQVSVG